MKTYKRMILSMLAMVLSLSVAIPAFAEKTHNVNVNVNKQDKNSGSDDHTRNFLVGGAFIAINFALALATYKYTKLCISEGWTMPSRDAAAGLTIVAGSLASIVSGVYGLDIIQKSKYSIWGGAIGASAVGWYFLHPYIDLSKTKA